MDGDPISSPYESKSDESLLESVEAQRLAAAIARWQRAMSALLGVAAVVILGGLLVLMIASGEDAMESLTSLLCTGVMLLLCYVLPAVLLWRAADSAAEYSRGGGLSELLGFTHRQAVFWRSMGYLVLIGSGLWLLLLVVAMLGVAFIGSQNSF
ncbi:hypothetical protein [Roseimaritima ulvae]|uniref:Uncharacterized protein n=1 Tax=Roseimaritima ulvae TaxID=980254 RepID=A0A5B9QV12_9BACT|nr:hypothetical protein [Roseimaritima ulvae]QEG41792.1 hypothetical protein UC8_38180 [Roseimaritima ulvae]